MNLKSNAAYSLVIYTDGGARPNPGFIGIGVHGYIYDNDVKVQSKQTISNRFGDVMTYAVPTTGGYAYSDREGRPLNSREVTVVHPEYYFDNCCSHSVPGTNNQAELRAFRVAIEKAKELGVTAVLVISDSEYVLTGLKNRQKSKQYFTALHVPNADLWNELMKSVDAIETAGVVLETKWIRAHTDALGNTNADWLATIAVLSSRQGVQQNKVLVRPARKYWEPTVTRHPFLNFKRMYFNRLNEYNRKGQYYTADPGKVDDHIGKRTPDSGYAVIRLKKPCPIVEAVRERQFHFGQTYNAVMVIRMERIFEKDVYGYLSEYGGFCLQESERNNANLVFLDKTPVTVEQYPMGQMVRALDTLAVLEDILDKFQEAGSTETFNKTETFPHYRSVEITDELYEKIEKKRGKEVFEQSVLRKDIGQGYVKHLLKRVVPTVHGDKEVKVPLSLGLDLPARNNLKNLEGTDPHVYLITWSESERSLRYACIVTSGDDIGIWSNFFADRILL